MGRKGHRKEENGNRPKAKGDDRTLVHPLPRRHGFLATGGSCCQLGHPRRSEELRAGVLPHGAWLKRKICRETHRGRSDACARNRWTLDADAESSPRRPKSVHEKRAR
eukprot:scaffold625_cov324-Pavlova_lutheri.AAC.92